MIAASNKKPLLRQCVTCRELTSREELLRVVYNRPEKAFVLIQPKQTMTHVQGRSAYVCISARCLGQALKAKRLSRALKTPLPDDIVKQLAHILSQCQEEHV